MFLNWWTAFQSGWTSNTPMNLHCQPSNAMVVVSIIPLLVCSSALLDMTGMTKSIQIFSVLDETHSCSSIGYAPSFLRLTPTTIIRSTSAFVASIVVLMDPAATLRKGFYRAYCWWRLLSIFSRRLPRRMISPSSKMKRTMRRICHLLRKPTAQKLARRRPIHERRSQLIYKWLASLHGLLLTQRYRYEKVFDMIHISHNFLACSCTLRCAFVVHWTQRHELPRYV